MGESYKVWDKQDLSLASKNFLTARCNPDKRPPQLYMVIKDLNQSQHPLKLRQNIPHTFKFE